MPDCVVCNHNVTRRTANMCQDCYDTVISKFYDISDMIKCTHCGTLLAHHEDFVRHNTRTPRKLFRGVDITHTNGILIFLCCDCADNYTPTAIKSRIYNSATRCSKCSERIVPTYCCKPEICDKCFLSLRPCDDCGERGFQQDMVEIPENKFVYQEHGRHFRVCSTCHQKLISCDRCKKLVLNRWNRQEELKIKRIRTGEKCCRECKKSSGELILNSYNYKPAPSFYPKKLTNTLYLGIELEAEVPNNTDREELLYGILSQFPVTQKLLYFKTDGSLDFGIELVSHPATLEYHKSEMGWGPILEFLKNMGATSFKTETCGLHVHVNKSFLTNTDQLKLHVFCNSHANKISVISRRTSPRYAMFYRLSKRDKHVNTVHGHYSAVNFQPSKTVEFRTFKGTLKFSSFLASLEFVDSICRFVKKAPFKLLYQRNLGWNAYIDFIEKKKVYKELYEFLSSKKLLKVKVPLQDTVFITASPEEDGTPVKFNYRNSNSRSGGRGTESYEIGIQEYIDSSESD